MYVAIFAAGRHKSLVGISGLILLSREINTDVNNLALLQRVCFVVVLEEGGKGGGSEKAFSVVTFRC